MRRAELLVTQIQRATENERVGTTDGISVEEYYQYLTDGLRFLQRKILGVAPEAFRQTYEFSATGVEAYALPTLIFAKSRVARLEYSASGTASDYRPLDRVTQLERVTRQGLPSRYLLESGNVLVNAYPAAGAFRLTYDALLPAVDKRRATVSSHTKSSTALTALTLAGYTADDYALSDHLTIVGFDGTVKMRGIPYTAVNSGTGVVSIQGSSYTFPVGSTLDNGDYVCLGEYASTHPQIDTQAEDFLITYGQRRILKRDSSLDANDIAEELADMWMGIVDSYGQAPDEVPVPVTNTDYFTDLG